MIKQKPTVTIGIAAYNESDNVRILIRDILDQRIPNATLESIVVASDGSTDDTVIALFKEFTKNVVVIDNKIRQGKPRMLNQILKKTQADILVLLDADVRMPDKHCIQTLIEPIISRDQDLTSARVEEIGAANNTEKMLMMSMQMKRWIYEHYDKGNNIYTCHGRGLALSKKLYSQIVLPEQIIADDAFIYLSCLNNFAHYTHVPKARIFYMLPQTIEDHKKQSVRFFQGKKQLQKYFGAANVKQIFTIPFWIVVQGTLLFGIKKPLLMLNYFWTTLKMKSIAAKTSFGTSKWEMAKSSKTLSKIQTV